MYPFKDEGLKPLWFLSRFSDLLLIAVCFSCGLPLNILLSVFPRMHLSNSARLLSFTPSNFTNNFNYDFIHTFVLLSSPLLHPFFFCLPVFFALCDPPFSPLLFFLGPSLCEDVTLSLPLPSLLVTLSHLSPPEEGCLFYACLNRDRLLGRACVCARVC